MKEELRFYTMNPADHLLADHDDKQVWCLSEPGEQYLVFAANGCPFKLQLEAETYPSKQWMDAKTGVVVDIPQLPALDAGSVFFTPPDTSTDWILLIVHHESL
jgi:hypothetical protein